MLDELREKCPWDRKQTNESLRPNTIEETFELCDALLKDDEPNICKELGDVLLHVCFYAKIGQEKQQFDMADVCNKLVDKLIFRHPHVYHPSQVGAPDPKPLPYGEKEEERDNSEEVKTAQQVMENWEQIKLREKDGNKRVLSGVPDALPALIKAYRIQDKARNVGFDWEDKGDVWGKVREELGELETELRKEDREHSTEEFGDFLFSLINAARLYKINPDTALEKTNAKFIRRFNYIEEHSIRIGKPLKDMTLGEMDALWNEAKAQQKKSLNHRNMNKLKIFLAVAIVMLIASCNDKKQKSQMIADDEVEVADSTVYGVCGSGTSMHSMELITDAGDTLTYTILDAEADMDGGITEGIVSNVEGGFMAGDKMAVTGLKTADGELVATRVINVTSLLGHWTSIDRNFMIEEGGTVHSEVKAETNPWTSWKILNGQLLLNRDTFDITSLSADSLYLENQKGIYIYKRQK